jgi:anti-sigma regulatory factor (Ser/Thr protein kinase)
MTGVATSGLRRQVPATIPAVEEFCREFRAWHRQETGASSFPAELLLREALNNAVLHGTPAGEPFVFCAVRRRDRRLLIVVRDAGAGFDWKHARGRRAGMTQTHGRGLSLYRSYAERVRFNAAGNCIALLLRF